MAGAAGLGPAGLPVRLRGSSKQGDRGAAPVHAAGTGAGSDYFRGKRASLPRSRSRNGGASPGFYARNGAKTAGYETALFGVPYKTLYWSKKPVDDSVLMEQHRHIYESRFSPEKLDRFIRIPYDPAEPLVATPWEE